MSLPDVAELTESNPFGALLVTYSFTPFHQQPREVREQILFSLKHARTATMRKIFDSLIKLSSALYVRNSDLVHKAMLYEPTVTAPPPEGHFQFQFADPQSLDGQEFDAIIVGSGSGGGVAAKELSEAGMKVLVIEKGLHYDLAGQAYDEREALKIMYDLGGLAATETGELGLVSGNVFGGGSSVNWAACIQTPAAVRNDWATTYGLPYFKTQEFQQDLDAVWKQMGVSLPKKQNLQNQLLMEGARRLGYAHGPVAQNNGNADHNCNHDCANGCRSGGKKGGVHSWLIDAAKAGSTFVVGCSVRKILFTKSRHAKGVLVKTPEGKKIKIKAPRVIAAGGSIQTPALLLRSRIPNPRIGTSIYLHPTNYVYAVFPQRTHPTEGQILTSVVTEFANLTESGHGVRLETGIMQPIVSTVLMQWHGGKEYKANIAKHSHMAGLIAIARDRDHGYVQLSAEGEPIVHYTTSAFDQKSVLKGTVAAAECMLAVGAEEIIVNGRGVKPYKKGDDFAAWAKQVEATPSSAFGSAHQMGSCRMSSRPGDGTCDPSGAVRGVQGVWCADASVLPSASGVNPMISTMAVARKVSRGIVDQWKHGDAGKARL